VTASVHYTEATCSTFLNQTPTLLRQHIQLLPFFMDNQVIQNTPYPELHKSQLHLHFILPSMLNIHVDTTFQPMHLSRYQFVLHAPTISSLTL